jgi:hypothetical protein
MLSDVLGWVIVLMLLLGGICLLGMAVPFRPFGSRRRAAQWLLLVSGALLATNVGVAAVAPQAADQGQTSERVTSDSATAPAVPSDDGAHATVEDDAIADGTGSAEPSSGLVTMLAALTPRAGRQTDTEPRAASLPSVDSEPAVLSPALDALAAAVRDALGPATISGSGPELRFPETAFTWTDATRPHRAEIVEIVNRIARQHQRCPDPDPKSVTRSAQGTAGDPVFLVSCGRGHEAFRLRFRPGDAARGRVFAAVRALDAPAAISACVAVARARGAPPVQVSETPALTYVNERSGLSRIQTSFATGAGAERSFDIDCLFEGPDLIEATIIERAD